MFLSALAFLGSRRAEGQDKSPWGDFWFSPVGIRTSSGVRVTPASAMRLSAVFACTKVVSQTFAVLPFKMFRRRPDGGRDREHTHWLARLMRTPNRWQSAFEWREMLQAHLCLRGNAFNEIFDDGRGAVTELIPIHPDRIKAEATELGYRYAITNPDGSVRRVERQRIWHIRALTLDGVCGLNPIEVAAEVMGVALSGQSYAGRFFANDARPAGWIEYEGKFATSEAKQFFRDTWQKLQGGANRGKTAVLEKGFKYNESKINLVDLQFLELMKQSRSEIAGIFNVPPHMIGDLERATFTNIEQQSLDFVNNCMQPWAERWESSIRTAFLSDDDSETYDIEFDFANLLRGDMAARTAYYSGNIQNGSLTRNEARISEGRNPLDGLDKPLQPVNMQGANDPAPVQPTNPPKPAPAPSPKPRKRRNEGDEQDETQAAAPTGRVEALARSAAERLARRETAALLSLLTSSAPPAELQAAMVKHAAVVQQSLGVSSAAAAAYVEARIADPIRADHAEDDIYSAAFSKLETLALEGTL